MQVPVQITIRDVPHYTSVEKHIYRKAQKLNQFCKQLIACNIVLEQVQKHQNNGKLFNVRIYVSLPRKIELVINHNQNENMYIAIRDAFEDMTRKIEEASQKLKGDIKVHPTLLEGHIVRLFNYDDFGFIESFDGTEYYFNAGNVAHPHFSQLEVGNGVRFIEMLGDEGPQAHRVKLIKQRHREDF